MTPSPRIPASCEVYAETDMLITVATTITVFTAALTPVLPT